MKRREFILALGAAAAATWSRPAFAQKTAMPVIGWIDSGTRALFAQRVAGFTRGLASQDFVVGQNVTIEERWAEGQYERLPAMAAELVQKNVAVLAATGAVNATKAAIQSTKTIPVVFANGGDPVALGLVPSLNQPGGNATGVSFFLGGLGAKRLEMMRTLAPGATTVAVLANPANPVAAPELADIEAAGRALGLKVIVLNAGTDAEIDAGFALIAQQQVPALLVNTDSFLSSRRDRITAAAARQSIPAVYSQREFLPAGGLMSYGTSIADGYRQAGVYVGRILKGAKPSELPVLLPTKFELVINLKTAKTLGIEIPPGLMTSADEVIE
jgi:putative ABC transport system substrate-binding protein